MFIKCTTNSSDVRLRKNQPFSNSTTFSSKMIKHLVPFIISMSAKNKDKIFYIVEENDKTQRIIRPHQFRQLKRQSDKRVKFALFSANNECVRF